MNGSASAKKNYINYMRVFAIICVVLFHCMQRGEKYFDATDLYKTIEIGLSFSHVPVLMLIAGFLCRKQEVKHFLKKKIFYILIPFLFFTTLKLIANCITGTADGSLNISSELSDAYLTGDNYWFCYSLLTMFVIATLLWKIQDRKYLLILIWAASVALYTVPLKVFGIRITNVLQINSTLKYLPYFLEGFILSRFDVVKDHNEKKLCIIGCPLAVVLFAVSLMLARTGWTGSYIGTLLGSISISFLLLVIFRAFKKNIKVLDLASGYTLQIYFIEPFIRTALFFAANKIMPVNALTVVIIAAVNIILCVLIARTVSKTKYLSFLFGEKKEQNNNKQTKEEKKI